MTQTRRRATRQAKAGSGKRVGIDPTLTDEQRDDVRLAFDRCKRSSAEADRVIARIPDLMRDAAEFEATERALRRVILRGPRAMSRDMSKLSDSARNVLSVLSRHPVPVWSGLSAASDEHFRQVVTSLEVLLAAVSGFRPWSKFLMRRGEPRHWGQWHLLRSLALLFGREKLPRRTTPSGLFASVALAIHTADPRPNTIKHSILDRCLKEARRVEEFEESTRVRMIVRTQAAGVDPPGTLAELVSYQLPRKA